MHGLWAFHEAKMGIKTARSYVSRIEEHAPIEELVLITRNGSTKQAFLEMLSACARFQQFTYSHLIRNITKHQLVPRHRLIPENERVLILQALKCNKLPHIKTTDPVVRYYNFTKGSIIAVDRKWGDDCQGTTVFMEVR